MDKPKTTKSLMAGFFACCAFLSVSEKALAQGQYEMRVDNYDKLALFFMYSPDSLHATGDLKPYGDNAYLIQAPMSHKGWAQFVNSGLPKTGPGIIAGHKNYTRITDGQCVTFAEWMTNSCGLTTHDYIAGKRVVSMNNPGQLLGRAIAKFDCRKSNGQKKFCQGEGKQWGHIVIVLKAQLGKNGMVESAWVVDSNTYPTASVSHGGVIAKRLMKYGELSKYYIVTHNHGVNKIKCRS